LFLRSIRLGYSVLSKTYLSFATLLRNRHVRICNNRPSGWAKLLDLFVPFHLIYVTIHIMLLRILLATAVSIASVSAWVFEEMSKQ
jgi:hypothetical protein